jgi:hypothetical protein
MTTQIYYPQDYRINYLTLIGNNRNLDMTNLVVEFSYFEDLFAFSVTGYVILRDSAGYTELKQMVGDEYLEIDFGKTSSDDNNSNIVGKYRIYKIDTIKPVGNITSEIYKLYFCSEELVLSEQNKICKSFKGRKISDMVKFILTDRSTSGKLQIQSNKVTIEDTTGVYDFVIPIMKPFEAISWLSTYARPSAFPESADMLFYQNRDGFFFKSLQSMYGTKVFAKYNYIPKNLPDTTIKEKIFSILDYEIVKPYDVISNINTGVYANKVITVDTLTRRYYTKNMNNAISQRKKLNVSDVLSPMSNRLGISQDQSYDACLKMYVTNSNQVDFEYFKQRQGSIEKDIFAEKYVTNRTIDISSLDHTRIKFVVPGNPTLKVGTVVELNIPKLNPTDKTNNALYSGKYLITAIRHLIESPTVYKCIVEASKDSYDTRLATINTGDPSIARNLS